MSNSVEVAVKEIKNFLIEALEFVIFMSYGFAMIISAMAGKPQTIAFVVFFPFLFAIILVIDTFKKGGGEWKW